MSILNKNDTIALISCSNALDISMKKNIDKLITILKSLNLNVITSNALFKNKYNSTENGKFRANELMNLYNNKDIKAIFDLSGGDLCNEILDFLDYNVILKSNTPFIGYSDLTVILNALYTKTNLINFNYQLRNLIRENSLEQIHYFRNVFLENTNMLEELNYKFIKGKSMEGVLIGGNIRCFLKLAGTEYMPDFKDKILFLEALSGDVNKISTFIAQYKQLRAFSDIKGLILGKFTELEETYNESFVIDLFLEKLQEYDFPIIKTSNLGHSANSKAICIGEKIILS
ncbi:LD-carboxypeptidase [Clostridium sp. Sa3CUN1]|uniref:LD-carboxypeptidase n=1 Tax=Clostridium gallinarum TaxID=2762246 RepID=A0ABR8Q4K9_9CLOT|nr:S66 peptidase family protein [Clostridium gallinarum]MBD7915365.1 LD-carboxypeptidase [Clostridium gallinarum]